MDDLEFLGERTISVDYHTTLGINGIEKINGVVYDGKLIKNADLSNLPNLKYSILKRALPDVFEEYPQADYIIVCNEKLEKNVLFLGSIRRAEAKVKIYSFKN